MRSGGRDGGNVLEGCRVPRLKQRKSEGQQQPLKRGGGASLGLTSLPSPCLPSQGVDRWLNQSVTPPLCTLQPGGARVSSGDTPGGHLLPPGQPAAPSLAALGRGSQGKLPPGSALHSPASGGILNKSQRTCEEEHCGQSKEVQELWGGRNRGGPKQRQKGAGDSKGRKGKER